MVSFTGTHIGTYKMIGIIAGEIIGSPYRKENIPDINGIFFPLFEDNRVMDPRTYRERTYKAASGPLADAVLKLGGDVASFSVSKPDIGEAMCQAIVIGRMDAKLGMSFDRHGESLESFLRFFPEAMHERIVDAADAAYRLERKMGASLFDQMGQMNPPQPEIVSAMLKGLLIPDHDGTYTKGDGKADDGTALQGAICAVGRSHSWEEAARRAIALGGNSPLVAALAGGLAEIAFGIPEGIEFRAREYLSREQLDILRRSENNITSMSMSAGMEAPAVAESETRISVYSLPGRTKVYAIPEGRPDIEKAIRKVNPDSAFVSHDGLKRIIGRMSARRDADGNPLGGTFIDSPRPELRPMYFRLKDGRLYSPSTLPEGKGFSPLDIRLKTRTEFARFVESASAIRDEQERKVGHDPAEGHLRFDTAWHLDIGRDKVSLYKGGTAYGEFGLDDKGRMRVNQNVVGGRFGGEYLQGAMDNQRVFHKNDGPAEILARLGEKCLDDGFVPDEERAVRSNYEMMLDDLSRIDGEIPRAVPVADEDMAVRTAETNVRHDYASSSEAKTFDEALYGSMHKGAVFTIGHSNLSIDGFIANLRRNGITVVRDVRSWPHSKAFPQFNREALKESLEKSGIRYIFNGDVMGGHVRRADLPDEGDGVRFTMSEGGYAQRTRENAEKSDLTIAFAADFTTAGEKVTEKAAKGKLIQIPLEKGSCNPKSIASDILSCMTGKERSTPLDINIAGNGMSTFTSRGFSQEAVTRIIVSVMKELTETCGVKIRSIRSGGQTGADEAGIMAAKELGIPAEVHAPKGWLMRGPDGKDVFNEYAFKERFTTMPSKDLSYEEMTRSRDFKSVYDEIVTDARKGERQALMCAETSPSDCHRFACIGYSLSHPSLVGRRFNPVEVQHIKRDGSTISQEVLERKACKDAMGDYKESELPSVMRKIGERIQHPRPEDRAIRLSLGHPGQNRKR